MARLLSTGVKGRPGCGGIGGSPEAGCAGGFLWTRGGIVGGALTFTTMVGEIIISILPLFHCTHCPQNGE